MNRKRVLVVLWVLAPIAVVVGLWYAIDRSASRPEAAELRRRAQSPTADPRQYMSSSRAEERAMEDEARGRVDGMAGVMAGDAIGTVRRIRIAGVGGRPVDLRVWTPPGVELGASAQGVSPEDRLPVVYVLTGQDLFVGDPRPAEWPAPIWGVDTALGSAVLAGNVGPMVVVGVPTDREERSARAEGAWLSERVVRATEAALPMIRRDRAGRAVVAADARLGAAMDAGSRGTFGAVVLLDGRMPGDSAEALDALFSEETADSGDGDGGDVEDVDVVESVPSGPRVVVIASDSPRSPATAAARGWFERRGAMVFVLGEPASPGGRGAWLAEHKTVWLFE